MVDINPTNHLIGKHGEGQDEFQIAGIGIFSFHVISPPAGGRSWTEFHQCEAAQTFAVGVLCMRGRTKVRSQCGDSTGANAWKARRTNDTSVSSRAFISIDPANATLPARVWSVSRGEPREFVEARRRTPSILRIAWPGWKRLITRENLRSARAHASLTRGQRVSSNCNAVVSSRLRDSRDTARYPANCQRNDSPHSRWCFVGQSRVL